MFMSDLSSQLICCELNTKYLHLYIALACNVLVHAIPIVLTAKTKGFYMAYFDIGHLKMYVKKLTYRKIY